MDDSLTKSFSNGIVHGHGYFDQKAPSIKQFAIEVSEIHNNSKLTCISTIPGYLNQNEDYADVRRATARSKRGSGAVGT